MRTFLEWLTNLDIVARLRLLETYFTFDAAQYNAVFEDELEKLIQRVADPTHRQVLERMRGFDWMSYIAASARNAGFRDYRQRQEVTADVASKLLMGKLFSGFDERISGPFNRRFSVSVANSLRNVIEKQRNRRRNLPTASTSEYEPAVPSSPVHDDDQVVEDFRELVRTRLGELVLAILDFRLIGGETKSLVGSPSVGNASQFAIKRAVKEIKALAQQYATALGDPVFLRNVKRAMDRENATIQKRLAARQS
jgi:hypothetical protein